MKKRSTFARQGRGRATKTKLLMPMSVSGKDLLERRPYMAADYIVRWRATTARRHRIVHGGRSYQPLGTVLDRLAEAQRNRDRKGGRLVAAVAAGGFQR